MQALSQLSYGPTLLLLADHLSVDLPEWPALHRLMSGVPTGIRTPVATVKG